MKRRGGAGSILIFLIIAFCIALVFEFAAPRIIASHLEGAIKSGVDGIDSVRIRLGAFPVLRLITSGKVNSLSIDCTGLWVEGLRVESLMIDARDIIIDMQALREEGKFFLSQIGQGRADLVIGENDLTMYVKGLKGIPESVLVELAPGRVTVKGDVSVAGISIPVNVDGEFVPEQEGTALAYRINNIQIAGAKLPSVITDGLLSSLSFSLDISDLPVPVVISGVSMEDDILRITGRTLSNDREGM